VEAVRDTIVRFEATGSPVVTDGEQRKPSFATTGERLDARARARGGYRGWGSLPDPTSCRIARVMLLEERPASPLTTTAACVD
jgi:hypothetical protein